MLMKASTVLCLSGSLIAIARADGHKAIHRCCQDLENAPGLKGKVYFPQTKEYEARIESYWSRSAALEPWCMVQPSTAEDVSVTIKTLVAGACPFGIRGGGHGSFALSNSVKDGVTIDFGNMKATTWNPDTKLVSVRPGSHWNSVYEYLAPYGITVAGGRVGTVGVGGFLTGGGKSFHADSHGMGCDNVANFEVVLADGSIVNANATNNPDLWQALKGSGGNLGLITRFDMYSIELTAPENPVIWKGDLAYNPESGPAFVDAFVEFADNVHKDEDSSCFAWWRYKQSDGMFVGVNMENTMAKVRPPAFDVYYTVDGIQKDASTTDIMSTVTNEVGIGFPPGFHNAWFTTSFKNDARPMTYAVDKFAELNAAIEKLAPSLKSDFFSMCIFQPLTKSMVDKSITKGGNVMGLDKYIAGGNGNMLLISLLINSEEAAKLATPLISAYIKDVEAYAESLGLNWGWKYMNYAHSSQEVISTFGEEAVAKLRAASAKYDPKGVFQKLRGSGFKIPKEKGRDEL